MEKEIKRRVCEIRMKFDGAIYLGPLLRVCAEQAVNPKEHHTLMKPQAPNPQTPPNPFKSF